MKFIDKIARHLGYYSRKEYDNLRITAQTNKGCAETARRKLEHCRLRVMQLEINLAEKVSLLEGIKEER